MDGKAMGFLQKEAGKAVANAFATGLTADNLVNCAVVQIQFYEAMQESLFEAEPPSPPLACAPGCDACCHRKVVCSIPEAIGVAAWLGEKPAAEQQRVLAASRALHDATAALDDIERIRTQLPCPMLVESKCSIYEIRPLSCRANYSFSRPACDAVYRELRFDGAIPHYDLMIEAHAQMLLGYGRALEKLGLDGGLVELASALKLILEDPGVIGRYLAGERPFETAKVGRAK